MKFSRVWTNLAWGGSPKPPAQELIGLEESSYLSAVQLKSEDIALWYSLTLLFFNKAF